MSMIQTIHLIHHTHHDLGYTDPPASCWRLFERYHERVLRLIAETADLPEEARFRWSCEVFEPTRRFLERADPDRHAAFLEAVDRGCIEVGGLPWTGTALMSPASVSDRFEAWRAAASDIPLGTAFQVDVTGASWGLIPLLERRGTPLVWLSSNPYSSGVTTPRPRFVRWEGPEGRTLPLYLAPNYNTGADWFHERPWRRGPVPGCHNPFFSPPEPDEFFAADPASLDRAQARLHAKLKELTHWPWPVIAVPVTNDWRFDNDPPNPALPHFVAAWNAAGLTPRLELSTPARFLRDFQRRVGLNELPRLRGDLCDWWMDGIMSVSETVVQGRRAAQRLRNLPPLARAIDADLASLDPEPAARARWEVGLIEEHTVHAYESVPRPSSANSLAGLAETLRQGASANEATEAATLAVLQSSPRLGRFARDPVIAAVNPHPNVDLAGWIAVPARAIRRGCKAIRDLDSGAELPIERHAGAEMDCPCGSLPEGFTAEHLDTPIQQEWGFAVTELRSLIPPIAPGSVRRFEPLEREPEPSNVPAAADPLTWEFDPQTGRILAARCERSDVLGPSGPEGGHFAEPIVEAPVVETARHRLLTRSPTNAALIPPEALTPTLIDRRLQPGYERLHRRFTHPALTGVDQYVTRCRWQPWIEVETRLHLKDRLAPLGVSLALPLAGDGQAVTYRSMGLDTRLGHDQAEEAGGEFFCTDHAVWLDQPGPVRCVVDCRDTPILAADRLATRSGRTAFVPGSNRLYAVLHQSWWQTNFSHTRTGTITFVHRLNWAAPRHADPTPPDPLVCFPGVR